MPNNLYQLYFPGEEEVPVDMNMYRYDIIKGRWLMGMIADSRI